MSHRRDQLIPVTEAVNKKEQLEKGIGQSGHPAGKACQAKPMLGFRAKQPQECQDRRNRSEK
jgi:hypothetical protein